MTRFSWIVGALLAAGTLLRVGYVLSQPDALLDPDEADYIGAAQGLLQTGTFRATIYFHVPPVVPILFAGALALGGPPLLTARLFQCALFPAIAAVAYLLGRRLGGPLAGLLTLVSVAVYPYFIFFAGQAVTETAATLFVPLALFAAIVAAQDPRPRNALLFGLSLAVASLARASACYFVLAIPLIFLIALGLRNLSWAKASGWALGGFLLLYAPWCLVNFSYFGAFIPTPTIGSGVMLYQTALRMTMPDEDARLAYLKSEVLPKYYYPPGGTDRDRLEGDRYLSAEGKRMIRENLEKYPAVLWENFSRFWQFYPKYSNPGGQRTALLYKILGLSTYGLLFPLMVAGGLLGLRRLRAISGLYGFIVYFTLVHTLMYGKLRYRIPMDPLLLAFASLGAVGLLAKLRPRWAEWLERWTGCPPAPSERRSA